ncbi:hemolysin family protein [Saccharomonospora iraqiensis]|uniref:hemolysin family protein n=1 Tax=Saccharomonospora iraqiensis TaxID=52698 RepID=UPI00022DFCA9|nr:hemolysin family protein [Saccharomonospora iraqiensis]
MLTATLTLLLGILAILVIIAANGYFVAQEFTYMSVDRARLRAQAAEGDRVASRVLSVTERTSFMLSGAQLGITVTGLLIGYVAEPLVGESLGVLLGGAGVPASVSITVATVLALAVSTVVQMIFGELFPKNLAIANPGPLARGLVRSTRLYLTVFGWLITVFDHAANALLRLVRIEPVHDVDSSATARDLEHIVADSRESGDLPEDLSMMLDRILDFPQYTVEHAMIPRSRVDTVEPDTTIGTVRSLMAAAHTRYPVIDAGDEPVGVVNLIEVLGTSLAEDRPVRAMMRRPMVVPSLMPLPEAHRRMTASRNHLACVIDEHGGFAGILTLEDVAEEVVGEITDEHDHHPPVAVEAVDDDTWRLSGDVHVDEVERALGHTLPRGDWETVSGLVIAHFGAFPAVGDSVRVELPADPADLALDTPVHRHLTAEVLRVAKRVPTLVSLTLHESRGEHDGDTRPGEEHG